MKKEKLASTYALAAYETAVGDWLGDLRGIEEKIRQSGLAPVLDDPALPFAQKEERLRAVLPEDLDPQARNFVYLLASKHDVKLLGQVIGEFEHLLQRGPAAVRRALATSAVPLTAEERSALEGRLRQRFGDNLDVEYRVAPSILGGVIVRVGDKVVDGSVAGKLAALREKLLAVRQEPSEADADTPRRRS